MLMYILLPIIFIFFSKINQKKINIFNVMCGIILTIIISIRYNVGTDFRTYLYYYNFPQVMIANNVEKGYYFLNILLKNTDYIFVLFVVASLIIYFIFETIEKESKIKWLSYLIFFFNGTFAASLNMMRQIMAASILLFAIKYLTINTKKYIFFITFASLFHKSALIFLLLIFLKKISVKKLYIFLVISLLSARQIIEFLKWVIRMIMPKYSIYFTNYISKQELGYSRLILYMLVISITILFYEYTIKKRIKIKKLENYYKLILIGQILRIIAMELPSILRFLYYFSMVEIIFFPNFLYLLKKEGIKYSRLYFYIILGFNFILYFRLLLTNGHKIIPFITIFQN